MATNKNRNTVRARNLSETVAKDLRNIILSQFKAFEKAEVTFDISFAPTCTDNGETSTAIIKFSPCMPKFLDCLGEKTVQINVNDDDDIEIDQDFFGLTQLYSTGHGHIPLDIVAVTGLNGHAFGSWTGGNDRMWLRDFLSRDKSLKTCRTMIFGYNAKLKDLATNKTKDFVLSFLEELSKARQSAEERNRPIVFIGHSFGGIVIAHTLVKAKERSHIPGDDFYGPLVKSTHTLLFFGVPHRGITLDDVVTMVEDASEYHRTSLLQEVIELCESITPVQESFINMAMSMKIVSFYEMRLTRAVVKDKNGKYGRFGEHIKVVGGESARFFLPEAIETSIPVDGDHSTMVKFTSRAHNTYQTVRGRLKEYLKSVESKEGYTSESFDCHDDIARGPEKSSPYRQEANSDSSAAKYRTSDGGLMPLITPPGPRRVVQPGTDRVGRRDNAAHRSIIGKVRAQEVVEPLLSVAIESEASAENGKSLLHEASRKGNLVLVLLLLEKGADPNVRDASWHSTPLHDAAREGTAAMKLLHRYHADLNARLEHSEDTPLHLAARNGHEWAVCFLLEKHADASAKNSRGRRPVHEAAEAGHTSLVSRLLEADPKCEVDWADVRGWTPLHLAAYWGHVDVVNLLLRRGASRDAMLKSGKRAGDLAEKCGHFDIRKAIDGYQVTSRSVAGTR